MITMSWVVQLEELKPMYKIGLKARNGHVKHIEAYGIDSISAISKELDCQLLSDILKSLKANVKDSEIETRDLDVDLLIGSSCIALFPVYRYGLQDICLMYSKFGVKKYMVVGSLMSTNDCDVEGTVSSTEIFGVRHFDSEEFVHLNKQDNKIVIKSSTPIE